VSAGDFRLPSAWRAADALGARARRSEAHFADIAPELDALAKAAGCERPAVLLAAHAKVLNTLVEEAEFATDLLDAAGDVRRVTLDPGAAATWRELAALAAGALPGTPAGPGEEAGDPLHADHAVFVPEPCEPDTDEGASGAAHVHGLRVEAHDGVLILRTGGFLDAGRLERLAGMYRGVLAAMAAGPDGDAVAAVLAAGERDDVLRRWAAGRTVERDVAGVLDLFAAQAARTPGAPAVRADGTTLTYRELDARSSRLAHHLLARGAGGGVPVGVCLRRGPDLLPALLAVWKCGAPYLPLDPDLPVARLRRMAAAAGCALAVTRAEHLPLLDPEGARPVVLDREQAAIEAAPDVPPGTRGGPADVAYVIYTSGSTGDPKGVLVHHAGLANYVLWTALEYAARGTGGSPHFSSIGFDLGVPSLFAPLVVGQRVDLLPDPLDPADLGALLVEGAPYSFVKMTPGHLNLLSTDLEPAEARGLAGLAIAAGDAFPVELARRWDRLAGPGGTPVATEYGPTEITVGNSGQLVTRLGDDGLVPLGLPIPNTTMYVLDDRLEPVPEGVPGEVCVGGAGVAHGYLGAPARTAERFVPDPYGPPGARLYRTGDRGRWRGGRLEFLGRTDHQVKIRGHRVEPGEVRAVLQRRPEVADAVVVARQAPSGAQQLAAFVVPAPGAAPDPARLRAALARELPPYMVPAEIVTVAEIPLTANGKADTRALLARA